MLPLSQLLFFVIKILQVLTALYVGALHIFCYYWKLVMCVRLESNHNPIHFQSEQGPQQIVEITNSINYY